MKKIFIIATSCMAMVACNKSDCPDGYSGDNCDMQITPVSLTMNSVDVSAYPLTKSDGSGWDITDGPDIFFRIYRNDTQIFQSDIKSDLTPGTELVYTEGMPFNIATVTDVFSIKFYDDDGLLGTEEMGSFNLSLYSPTNGFPGTLTMTNPDGSSFVFTMQIAYNH